MGHIVTLRPQGKITKAMLIQLGSDPDLEGFQIICHWKNDDTTVKWSNDIKNNDLVFGATMMTDEVNQAIFHRKLIEDE